MRPPPLHLWRIAAPMVVGTALLALWEIIVRAEGIPPYILPGPLLIAQTLWTDGPSLMGSLLVTLRITLAALAAAAILGGGIALLFSLSRILALSLFPYAVILQVTPIVAIAPLIIIWVREPFLALLVCAWIVAFFPVVANTTVGLNSADRNLLALFRLYGASTGKTLRYLKLPTALPYFLAGLRISGGLALIGAVVAEFVAGTGGTETGLAFRILEAGYRLAIPRLFAALFLLSMTGIVIYLLLDLLSRLLLRHWHESAIEEEAGVRPQPRPTNGIFVAITVRNWILASGVTVAMKYDGARNVLHIHGRLFDDRAIGLRHAALHALGHLGQCVADVDLAAGDVVFAAVERGRFREAGDRVLGRGVGGRIGPRRMRGDRAVVDDPPAHRLLILHDPERLLRAQEGARQDRVDDGLPALERQLFDRRGGAKPGVVEQHIEPTEPLLRLGEDILDRGGIGDIGRHRQDLPAETLDLVRYLLQTVDPPAADHRSKALLRQRDCCRLANPTPSAGDESDLSVRAHANVSLFRKP